MSKHWTFFAYIGYVSILDCVICPKKSIKQMIAMILFSLSIHYALFPWDAYHTTNWHTKLLMN